MKQLFKESKNREEEIAYIYAIKIMKKKGLIIFGIISSVIIIAIISTIIWYFTSLKAPKVELSEEHSAIVEVKAGTSTAEILNQLKQQNLIKNELVAKIYIKLNKVKNLQAGKYEFTSTQDLKSVLTKIANGEIMDETVKITFLEGKNMRYIAQTIAKSTNNKANDVYKLLEDKDYILSLIDKYWFLKTDIQEENIYYPLEGYLYPDTYTFDNKDVKIATIFETMLDQMGKVLSKYRTQIEEKKLSIHQVLTIASIIELEGNNKENREKIASVIYNRLSSNMSLGSDVTTYYAIKVDMGDRDLYAKEINTYNAYNTRGPNMNGKLPVGPIACVSEESIEAAINPAKEKYLYFVADKNGDIYFSLNYEEHQKTITTLKKKGLWYEY